MLQNNKGQASFEIIGVAAAVVLATAVILSFLAPVTDSSFVISAAKSKFISATCCGAEIYTLKGITANEDSGGGLTISITTDKEIPPEVKAALDPEIESAVENAVGADTYSSIGINYHRG